MDQDRERLVSRAVELQREIVRAMRAVTAPNWLELEVPTAQHKKALFVLADHGPLTISTLAQQLGIENLAASYLVERLVQLGFVKRYEDPLDRRRTFAQLTAQGAEAVGRLRCDALEHLWERVERLGDADLGMLCEGLDALVAATTEPAGPLPVA